MSPHDFIVRELDEIKIEVKEIRGDLQKLLEFKWQIIGGSLVLSGILTVLLQIILNRN